MESNESKVTIKIPRPLYNRIKAIVEGSGFNSVTDFVVYVLRDIVSGKMEEEHDLSAEELAAIRKRLKSLGYL
ncbi:CopG family transcriptional regulator [candidate division KSB1 bacterium]|nr:CopG family transcriptional regulator [candidate division KSB1 bacterium]